MAGKRKIPAVWIILIAFTLAIFSSVCFIIVHSDHNCTGADCTVCTELAESNAVLHTLGTAAPGLILFVLSLISPSAPEWDTIKARTEHITLISLKVELLD